MILGSDKETEQPIKSKRNLKKPVVNEKLVLSDDKFFTGFDMTEFSDNSTNFTSKVTGLVSKP
jgi:hypothetical protein